MRGIQGLDVCSGALKSLTPARLLALTVLVGIFVFVSTHPIRPHDFWWHLAAGREIARTGRIPEVDTFSFTRAGAPYPSYSMFWLAELLFYGLYTLGGPALVVFVHSGIITTAYSLILWGAWEASGPRAAALGVLLAAALGIDDWNVRPQTFAFLSGALFLRGLMGLERSRRWLWAFPLGMTLWVNTHGSFPIGLALVGLALVGKLLEGWRQGGPLPPTMLRRYGLAFLLAAACVGLNPRGFGVWDYVLTMARHPVIQTLVPEWAPPGLSRPGILFYAGLGLTGILLALAPRHLTADRVLIVAAFVLLGMKTSRGIVWFGMVAAPAVAAQIQALWPERPGRPGIPALNALLLGVLGGVALAALPWFKAWWPLPAAKAGLISAETPRAATEFLLRERPRGPLFHALSFGSYLIWAAQPDYPVFVDTRLELYPMAIWEDYLAISTAAPDWEIRLARYGVCSMMLSPTEQPALLEAVRRSPRWEQIYQDEAASIWIRKGNSCSER
ncbi:hypothetical protein [Thermoflexus sp.]|uniref:hypothetical protein n=1 Tax=Thermoflexus sp. TaxID=1969742 RepID=UPI0035E4311F